MRLTIIFDLQFDCQTIGRRLIGELAAGFDVRSPEFDTLGVTHRTLVDHLRQQEVEDHVDLAGL
jgi:hypothetical protein